MLLLPRTPIERAGSVGVIPTNNPISARIARHPLGERHHLLLNTGPAPNYSLGIKRCLFFLNFQRLDGGCSRTRTCDPLIKSQLLYQLSYTPGRIPPFAGQGREPAPMGGSL